MRSHDLVRQQALEDLGGGGFGALAEIKLGLEMLGGGVQLQVLEVVQQPLVLAGSRLRLVADGAVDQSLLVLVPSPGTLGTSSVRH